MSTSPTPRTADLKRLVRLVVETVHPLRIVLFGSAARGELHEDSDVDLLVLMPDGSNLLHTEMALYRALAYSDLRFERPIQFVASTPARFNEHEQSRHALAFHVVRDGRELYAA